MNLSPSPKQQFFGNNGRPLDGGLLFTYAAGTNNKIATYQDEAGTPNTNPIVLDFRGEANIWLDPDLTYKYVLSPRGDTDPPTNPIWTIDNIAGGVTIQTITQQFLGRILWPQTEAEDTAGVTPVNYFYPPGWVPRYATGGNGESEPTAWTGFESACQALLQLTEPFGKWIHFPSGRYSMSTAIETVGTCTITGDGMGVTAVTQTSDDQPCFKTTFRSVGHERIIISDITLVGSGSGSTAAGIDWVDTFYSRVDRTYVTNFYRGWQMTTNSSGGASSFGNCAYGSIFRSNYNAGIYAGFESNALALYSCILGGGGGVSTTYGVVFQDAIGLLLSSCDIEGCASAGILIQGTTTNVGASYHFSAHIHMCHFEAQVCNASDEGDIVLGLNGETNVLGVTVSQCFFDGSGSTYTPLNIIKGDAITFEQNWGLSAYANFIPQFAVTLTRYNQTDNFSGSTPYPSYVLGSSNLTLAKKEQGNGGVNSVGGGHESTNGFTELLNNQSITFQIYSGTLIQVQDITAGQGALFFAIFSSSTITEISDIAGLWSTTNTDTNPGWAIYKSSNTQTVTITNYMNSTRQIIVTLLGACGGATAPA